MQQRSVLDNTGQHQHCAKQSFLTTTNSTIVLCGLLLFLLQQDYYFVNHQASTISTMFMSQQLPRLFLFKGQQQQQQQQQQQLRVGMVIVSAFSTTSRRRFHYRRHHHDSKMPQPSFWTATHHPTTTTTTSRGLEWSLQQPTASSTRCFMSSSSTEGSSSSATTAAAATDNTTESTNAEKEAIKAAREARKAEKERAKAEKQAKKAKAAQGNDDNDDDNDSVTPAVDYLSYAEQDLYPPMGDLTMVMSKGRSGRTFAKVADLGTEQHPIGSTVWLRGRLYSNRVKGGSCFLVLRQDSFDTVQACYFKDKKEQPELSKQMLKYIKTLTVESIVDIEGTLVEAQVKSCSIQNVEVKIHRIYTVSKATPILPFLVEDAARSEQEVEDSQTTDRPFPRLGQELRLDHRWLDLRAPANNAIMRLQSAICQLFRESLYAQGFTEIHTPKLIAGESESGAGVFTTDYFGTLACLAQSPQLYKQMAISSDLERVFEIGPVFRAEQSHTRRHLCEFTGLDLEMAIQDHYMEALEVIHAMFRHIFTGLETRWARELQYVREQYASDPVTFTEAPCVLHWPEAMEILQDKGFDTGDGLMDLTGAMELALGEVVKEKYGTDFFMLDKYPSSIRPFYTMPDPEDARFSNSYDIFLRGQEICSGAQRCHDPELVLKIMAQKGVEPGEGLKAYVDSFRHGVSPHAGAGIGLERVLFLYLGLDNVRKASMFPRDPNRCTP